jgi:hypothetical protein
MTGWAGNIDAANLIKESGVKPDVETTLTFKDVD